MILAIRTDQPRAELYLCHQGKQIDSIIWQAHRELADTILVKIEQIIKQNRIEFSDLQGIIVFTGEGSFTGLRIGTTVANTLGFSLDIPVVAIGGEQWLAQGLVEQKSAQPGQLAIIDYHSGPNITQSKQLTLEE